MTIGYISHDLVMEKQMAFDEGSFRVGDGPWRVYIFQRDKVESMQIDTNARWKNGVTGIVVTMPEQALLTREVIKSTLAKAAGVEQWVEVRGPDSMQLR